MDKENKGKLFGRYHDLVILSIGFILTTLVGGYLTQSWQMRSAQIQREAEHKRTEQVAATRVFEEVSLMMDKRLYRMRRIHNGLADNKPDSIMNKRWDSYREILFEWNENLNRNLALIQRYFGADARYILEDSIQGRFLKLGRLLEGKRYPDHVTDKYQHRQDVADGLNNIIYQFDIDMISSIQTGNIGAFRALDYP